MPEHGPVPVIVCADDYGMSPHVSDAILALAIDGRLSAISCMVTEGCWPRWADRLVQASPDVDVGLHLVLPGLSAPRALIESLRGALPVGRITEQYQAQLDRFVDQVGRPPDFIDGHEYVHQLPGVCRATERIIGIASQGRRPVYCRNAYIAPRAWFGSDRGMGKRLAVSVFGRAFRRRLRRSGIPTNPALLGVYRFRSSCSYTRLFEGFARNVRSPNTVIVTHPGALGSTPGAVHDPIAANRVREREFLASDAFVTVMRRHGLVPSRFRLATTDLWVKPGDGECANGGYCSDDSTPFVKGA